MYPNSDDVNEEMSFEELRANSRGWLSRDWAAESKQRIAEQLSKRRVQSKPSEGLQEPQSTQNSQSGVDTRESPSLNLDNTIALDLAQEGKTGRPKKTKIREVKGATQTSTLWQYNMRKRTDVS